MDKLSSQVRKMLGEWRSVSDNTYENSIGCGNEGDMYDAGYNEGQLSCADALETLLPQIEALEQENTELEKQLGEEGKTTARIVDWDKSRAEREDALMGEAIDAGYEYAIACEQDCGYAPIIKPTPDAVRERLARKG